MKKVLCMFLTLVICAMQITCIAEDSEDGLILKNAILHNWDFADGSQTTSDENAMNMPILSGTAQYNNEHNNIRLDASSGAGISVNLEEPVTAQTEENIINIEFDANFGKIDKQYFSYSVIGGSDKLIDCRFMPYNSSSAEGYLRVAGADIINATDELNINKQIVSCISAVTSDGMSADTTHFRNEINLALGTVTVYITSGNKSGSFTGEFDTEAYKDISGINLSVTKNSTSRYTYIDNLKISQYIRTEVPEDQELVHYVTVRSDGDVTAVDTSKMVYGGHISAFLVTTAKDGKQVNQYTTDIADTVNVDTSGADSVEIAPIYEYVGLESVSFNTESGATLEDMNTLGEIPDGRYNMTIQKADAKVTDIYVNGVMVVNNAEQTGKGRSNPKGALCEINDIKIEGGSVRVNTLRTEYNGITYPDAPISRITISKTPSIVERKTKITILGDSLVCNYYGGKQEELGSSQTGWGQQLANFLDSDKYETVNLANSGHYAKILYETAMGGAVANSLPGDIILCQVGYNDRVRSDENEMKEYMAKMAEDAENAGIILIFVAPPATCDPEDYGSGYSNPIDKTDEEYVNTSYSYPVRYGQTVQETAQVLGCGFIDLSKLSYDYLTSLYGTDINDAGKLYAENIGVSDYIHLSYAGAMKWASFIAQELYDNNYIEFINTDFNYSITDTEGNQIVCAVTDGEIPEPTKLPETQAPEQPTDEPPQPTEDTRREPLITEAKEIYNEDFSDGNISWNDKKSALSIKSGGIDGNYLSLESKSSDSGAYMLFEAGVDAVSEYVYECDVRLKAGNNKSTQFALMAEDYAFGQGNVNYGVGSGYIVKLSTLNSTEWTINPDTDNKTVIIPSTDWVHMSVSFSNRTGTTWLKITDGDEVLYSGAITPYSSAAVPAGVHLRGGKNYAVMDIDNIKLSVRRSFNEYSIYKSGGNIGIIITPDAEETVYAVLYGNDGRLLAADKAEMSGSEEILRFSVPDEKGAYIKMFNWDKDMNPLCDPSVTVYVDDINDEIPDYVLKNKKVYAFGDSIVYGHTQPETSFMRIITEECGMDLTMCAVNGASVMKSDNHILTQIQNAPQEAPDIIIFDGYTNDAYGDPSSDRFNSNGQHKDVNKYIGEIKGNTANEFDNTTFCGGFEEIIYSMKQKWPDTPIVFVTIHKSGGRDWDVQCRLRELAVEMCGEWGIDVVDIFNEASLDTRNEDQMSKYIIGGAGSHPNETACREFYIPVVKKHLKEAFADEFSGLS